MRIGTMSIIFREQLGTKEHIGYVECMERAKNAGFDVIDLNLCQICGHKTRLHLDSWQEEVEKIAEAKERLGISFPQCHLPFKSKKVKWETPEDYEYYTKMFYRAIDVAAELKFPWAVVHPDRYFNVPGSENWDLDKFIEENHREYDPLVEYALKKGVGIAFENMNRGRFSQAEELVAYIDSYHDDRIGACWDTGHANMYYKGGDQWEPLHKVGHRLHATHVHDNNAKDDLHLLPFEGTIDWPRVVAALKDIQYTGDFVSEAGCNFFTPDDMKDYTARHAHYVFERVLNND